MKQCHGMTKQLGIEGTGHRLDQTKQAKSLRESVDAENGFGLCKGMLQIMIEGKLLKQILRYITSYIYTICLVIL